MSAEAYARQLKQLLPRGRLWSLDPDSVLSKLCLGIAEELARVEGRGAALVDEVDPRTTLELLDDWERVLGLPDDCYDEPPTSVTERRLAAVQKLTSRGGATPQFFIDLAALLGFTVTITEYTSDVARAGTLRSGDRIYSPAWAYAFKVNVDLASPALEGWSAESIFFRSGTGRSGDRLRSWNGPVLECIIRRSRPAHTVVLFSYA
jgi:uncharacterized protein YmfQ (DUF2313 family)